MTLRIVGAGLPRTGTTSLKQALEMLTGEGCYHMYELLEHREAHGPLWGRIFTGDLDAFDELFVGYASAIDWPASAFWRELSDRHPEALVVLTHRGDAAAWWDSADKTVWEAMRRGSPEPAFNAMTRELRRRMGCERLDDPEMAMAAYDRHFDEVVATIDPSRLVIMQPGDGWGPICAGLGVEPPDEPYPKRNTTSDFIEAAGW